MKYLHVDIGCLECGEATVNMGIIDEPGDLPVIKVGETDPKHHWLWSGQGLVVAMEIPE